MGRDQRDPSSTMVRNGSGPRLRVIGSTCAPSASSQAWCAIGAAQLAITLFVLQRFETWGVAARQPVIGSTRAASAS